MSDIIFYSQFIASKVGVNGLTPTVDVESIERSTGNRTALVTGGTAYGVGRRGLYYYKLSDANINTYDYACTFITDNVSVDQQEIADYWLYWGEGVWSNTARTLTSFGTLVSDVWAYTARTLTSFGSLVSNVWNYLSRTLTNDELQDTGVNYDYSFYKYATVSVPIVSLGDLTDVTDMWFTVKKDVNQEDLDSILQIGLNDGLLYLYGVTTPTPTDGDISVDSLVDGDITISLLASATTTLPTGENRYYDVKVDRNGVIEILRSGNIDILIPVTRRTT